MANARKRILELTPLPSASLDTTIVGVDGGTTYRIELDVLADAVTSRVNILDRDRLASLESVTSSFESKGRSVISSSAQITAFGFISSSVTIPTGTISSSAQITSFGFISQSVDITSLNSFTSSQQTLNTAFTNGISARLQTSSFNDFSTSVDSRIIAATNEQSLTHLVTTSSFNEYTASQSTSSLVNRLNAIESVSGSWITESETGSLQTSITNLNTFTASVSTASLVTSISNLNSATSSYLTSLSGAISSSSQLTSSFDERYLTIGGDGVVSGSSQLTSSYDSRYVLSGSITQTTWDNIASKPSGIISGSSQLTASYDTRYTLSGSVVSGTTPAGTISGSSQLTSSFDGRYTQTGSFNTLTASFNSFTASAQSITTGSNSFNGTQTITGSLIITTGSFVASQILANTSSLYLTSGSNMYVQNNGVVEITGSLIVSGSAAFNVNVLSVDGRSGDEGGEINLAIPVTNTTLQNRVNVDIWQNRLRIFEGSAGANGVFIDLSKPTGNNNEITYKASGIVDAGTFVQLDNIKATVTTSGFRGLSLASVSGTFAAFINGTYTLYGGGVNGMGGSFSITTTPTTSLFNWSFPSQGDAVTYIINDTTNSRGYRITLMIGGSYLANFISIERLH